MKRFLSVTLALTLCAALAAPVLADEALGSGLPEGASVYTRPQAEDAAALPGSFLGAITVDGVAVDTAGIPGAPAGYIPMRAFCQAAGGQVSWYPEDNEAFFQVAKSGVTVDLNDLSVKLDNEPVEGVAAYLDPAGYTFLPVSFLTTVADVQDVTDPALSSVHYDFTTLPQRSELEQLADAVAEASGVGSTMQLDMDIVADFGVHPENFTELVALYPMMSANVSSVYIGQVAEGKLAEAQGDFAALVEFLNQSFGNYPACADMIASGVTVQSPKGDHLMLLVAPDVDAGVAEFEAAFPAKER